MLLSGLILYPPPPPTTGTKAAPAQQPKQAVKADKSGGEKSGQQRRNQSEGRPEGAGSRDYSASRDSGIDTATVSSSNLSPTSKTEQFTDIAEDQASPPVHHTAGARGFPCPEEKINLLTFDEIKTQYFQIQFTDEGLVVDRIIPALADCWSRVMSELLGRNAIFYVLHLIDIFLYRDFENSDDSPVRYPRPHPEDPDQQSDQTLL